MSQEINYEVRAKNFEVLDDIVGSKEGMISIGITILLFVGYSLVKKQKEKKKKKE